MEAVEDLMRGLACTDRSIVYSSGPSVLVMWASSTAPRLCPLIEDTSALEEVPFLEACTDILHVVVCCLDEGLPKGRIPS